MKANPVLAGLAVVAILATAVAAWQGASWAGEHTVRITTANASLPSEGPTSASGAGAHFNWTVPDNATAAQLQVSVVFSGQAVQGGSATVTVRVTTPDGHALAPSTVAIPIAAGATSASAELKIPLSWADVPSSSRDAGGHTPAALHWGAPLDVLVVAQAPAGDAPVASYAFTAAAAGTATVYLAA